MKLVAVIAVCSSLASGCQGKVTANEPVDESSGSGEGNTLPPPSDGGPESGSSSETGRGGQSDSGSGGTSPSPPPDGRCGLTPRMLVNSSTLPAPTDAGPVSAGVGTIVASTSDLYYTIYVVQNGSASGAYLAGSVMRVPLGGGQSTQVAYGYLFGQPLVTATSVVFLADNTFPNNDSDAIIAVPLSGGAATTLLTLASNDAFLNGIATDGTLLYFGDQNGLEAVPLASDSGAAGMVTIKPGALTDGIGVFGQSLIFTLPQGGIESVPLPPQADSPASMLGTTGAAPVDLSSCGPNACWLDEGNNSLEQMSGSGGTIARIALTGPLATAYTFAFDGTNFYVLGADSSDESLARIPSDGGCPVILVDMPVSGGWGVAVDDECVYWTNSEGIFSLAKTAVGPFHQ